MKGHHPKQISKKEKMLCHLTRKKKKKSIETVFCKLLYEVGFFAHDVFIS